MARDPQKPSIKIELTPEQQEQVLQATGLTVTQLQLAPEILEERVVPGHPVSPRPN